MRNLLFFFLLALVPAAIGCTESMIIIGGDGGGVDAGPGDDAGPAFDAGPGLACGANTCHGDEICCNASCGICTAPGEVCIDLACDDPVVCSGEVCSPTAACCTGCPGQPSTCSGPEGLCPAVICSGPVCGDEICPADSTACCPGCNPGEEICGGPRGECPPLACPPPDPCRAQDATFVGGCEPAPRYVWDGTQCVGLTGCSCEGTDCENTFGDMATCQAAYSMCGGVDCTVHDAQGAGDCLLLLGFRWDGFSCVSVGGCECVGADCATLPREAAECEARRRGCGPPPTCESDLECGAGSYCNDCARGSCAACEDCVSGCTHTECVGDGREILCDAIQPECGSQGVAVGIGGCWACVDARTCEPIPDGMM